MNRKCETELLKQKGIDKADKAKADSLILWYGVIIYKFDDLPQDGPKRKASGCTVR